MSISRRLFTGGVLGAGLFGKNAVESVAKEYGGNQLVGGAMGGSRPLLTDKMQAEDPLIHAAHKAFDKWRRENEPRQAHNINGYDTDILAMRSWSDSYKHMRNRGRSIEEQSVYEQRARELAESSPLMKRVVPRWLYEDDNA